MNVAQLKQAHHDRLRVVCATFPRLNERGSIEAERAVAVSINSGDGFHV